MKAGECLCYTDPEVHRRCREGATVLTLEPVKDPMPITSEVNTEIRAAYKCKDCGVVSHVIHEITDAEKKRGYANVVAKCSSFDLCKGTETIKFTFG